MWKVIRILAVLVAGLSGLPAQAEEKRVAVIIGNDDYLTLQPKLDNAANDARVMESALRAAGFETTLKVNVKRKELYQLINAFAGKIAASPETVGLFYYAGHGIQANGKNYLIPIDAELASEADLDADAVDAGRVLRAMDEARNRINIVILDACRDNPLPRGRSAARGLATMNAPRGTFIGYAAAPGQVAADGDGGSNGIFAVALAKAMTEPGVPIEQMYKKVIAAVSERTAGRQTPWMEASIQGDFYFFASRPQANIVASPGPAAAGFDPRQIEMAYWDTVKDSKNPAELQEYLKQYPKGSFAGLARTRIATLKAEQVAPPAPQAAATSRQAVTATPPPLSPPPSPTKPAHNSSAIVNSPHPPSASDARRKDLTAGQGASPPLLQVPEDLIRVLGRSWQDWSSFIDPQSGGIEHVTAKGFEESHCGRPVFLHRWEVQGNQLTEYFGQAKQATREIAAVDKSDGTLRLADGTRMDLVSIPRLSELGFAPVVLRQRSTTGSKAYFVQCP